MPLAIGLVLIVVGTTAFHFLSPWWFTPLASNWGQIDATLTLTIAMTGIVFIIINLLLAYIVIRFRQQKGRRAAFEPENKKLEWWLIGLTAIGVIILLAPGLFVYSELVTVPEGALTVEALAQQWKWSFRLPGEDEQLGRTDIKFMSFQNPFGLDPDDPNGQDDVLIDSNEIHMPLGKPVKVELRSKDVLHDFFVPQFRVKMDAVPGLITSFWLTPTRVGTFEIACAEYCGIGHHAMRGVVVVEEETAFQDWLSGYPTFAQRTSDDGVLVDTGAGDVLIEQGQQLARNRGCLNCHSVEGSPSVGPTWQGLQGKQETLSDGSTITVDDDYLRESIVDPTAKIVTGFPPVMPPYDKLNDEELQALIAYINSLSE